MNWVTDIEDVSDRRSFVVEVFTAISCELSLPNDVTPWLSTGCVSVPIKILAFQTRLGQLGNVPDKSF